MLIHFFLGFLSFLLSYSLNDYFIPLDAPSHIWTLSNKNLSISLPCSVPNEVQLVLLKNKIIDDPNYRFNDVLTLWIANDDWTFSLEFDIPNSLLYSNSVYLRVDGIDTYATISINGEFIGDIDNMFRQYYLKVPPSLLFRTRNYINVTILSPIIQSNNSASSYPYFVPETDLPPYMTAPLNRPFARKAQCHFGWDWGPALMAMGIYKTIGLQFVPSNGAIITNVAAHYTKEKNDFHIHFPISIISDSAQKGRFVINVEELGFAISDIDLLEGYSQYDIHMNIDNPLLWWPIGMEEFGSPKLYEVLVSLTTSHFDRFRILTGFRTLELVSPKTDTGAEFYFVINGHPIFSKGSNLIPLDSFENNVNKNDIYRLFLAAIASGQNTIRVWGGGVYQQDIFYELADRLGIMVWTEFMFACAMYPRHKSFLNNVENEVEYQMLRLMSHPSIMLWSANNENLGALEWFPETRQHKQLYSVDYYELYINSIYKTINRVDPTRPFWPSSPANGAVSIDPYVMIWENCQDPTVGDVHYYNYIDDCKLNSIYPRTRFASEYGFQSFPTVRTLKEGKTYYTPFTVLGVDMDTDFSINSPIMTHRQHHSGGNGQILMQIAMHFHTPHAETKQGFIDYIFLSQANHALCMEMETNLYRRLMGDSSIHTMGALYWQLNDIWQAPSWATIEYSGRWKMAHYTVKRSFMELSCSIHETAYQQAHSRIIITFTNDGWTNRTIIDPKVVLFRWDTGIEKTFEIETLIIQPQSSIDIFNKTIDSLLEDSTCINKSQCGIQVFVPSASYLHAEYAFDNLQYSNIQESQVTISNFSQLHDNEIGFVVSVSKPVSYLWLSPPEDWENNLLKNGCIIYFSDNGFTAVLPSFQLSVSIIVYCPPYNLSPFHSPPFDTYKINSEDIRDKISSESYFDHIHTS